MSSIVVGRSDGTLTLNGLALVGDVTGNVTGDVSGSAATVTGDTQAAITTLDNLTGYQVSDADLTAIAALAHTDGNFIIGDGDAWVAESGDTARISLGLGTTDSPTFTGLTLTGDISMASTHGIDWGGVSSITCNNTSRDIDINAGKQIALIGGTYISFSTTAGSVSLTASEEIKFKPSGNSDDYLIMQTVSNVPELTTLGDCDLKLSNTLGDSVLVSDLDDHLASTSNPHTVTADQLTLGTTDSPTFTGLEINGYLKVQSNNIVNSILHGGKIEHFAGNNGIGQSQPAFVNYAPETAVTGTRTSDTIFTRTADTWVAGILVGQYCFSYVNTDTRVGTWLKITANTTTALTISGVLYATCNRVITSVWNPIQNEYTHGKGGGAFMGGVFDGESIWLVPYNSDDLVKVNPSDGSMTSYAHGKGTGAFRGGVFDGESIWLVPDYSDDLVKVNPSDGSMTSYAHGKGDTAFIGGVFDGESIWLVPYSSDDLVKVNPSNGSMTSYPHGKGNYAFIGGVFDGESIWLVPFYSDDLVKVNPSDGSMTSYAHGKGGGAFMGGVFDGESIWLVPYYSGDLVKVNPSDGSMTSYAHGKGDGAFMGGVFDGESIWLVPYYSDDLVSLIPPRFGRTSLHTTGVLNAGGAAKINGSITLKEQAAADADTDAYGQLWVKTATPNELWFTDDAGNDKQLGTTDTPTFTGVITNSITTITEGADLELNAPTREIELNCGDVDINATDDIYLNASDNITIDAVDDMAIDAGGELKIDGVTFLKLRSDNAVNIQPNGDTSDYVSFTTAADVPQIGTVGDCDLKLANSVGDSVLVSDLDDHLASTSNPHTVTADQLTLGTDDSPEFTGLTLTGALGVTGDATFNGAIYAAGGFLVHSAADNDTKIMFGSDTFYFIAGGVEMFRVKHHIILSDEVVVNEGSADVDFRVETDANANAFKVDAATGLITLQGATVDVNGCINPVSIADATAANNSIYYSTDATKLVYKDSGGTVNSLY